LINFYIENMTKLKRNVWNETFKEKGKVFIKPQRDMPRIIKIFKKHNVKKVLDLGCGSGRHLVFLAKHGFDTYGIDIAKYGVSMSRNWLKEEELKANLKVCDIYKKLPYKDNFFDAIVSTRTLHHEKIGKIRKLIKEMERILRKNGLIFITVLNFKYIPKNEMKQIAPRTFIHLKGNDVGLPHYKFDESMLSAEFKNFKVLGLWSEPQEKIVNIVCWARKNNMI